MKKFIFALCAFFALAFIAVPAQAQSSKKCSKVCTNAKSAKVASSVMTTTTNPQKSCSKMSKAECKKMSKADCARICAGKSKVASNFTTKNSNKSALANKRIIEKKKLYKKGVAKKELTKA